ncbi:MAG TPA: glycine cleavage system protein GcvH [Chlamydiales bacterium]|jgi:glycine cleavage system H protein
MRFSKSHEWVLEEGQLATVGITSFAQKELGQVVFIQLPSIGTVARAGEETCVLESTKAAADVYSPVSGKIVAVNEEAAKDPSLLNQSPESKGWLFKIALSHPNELNQLLTAAEYQKLLNA